MNNKLKLVHVVFKTHLDIGFTDLASVITDSYLNEFIPKAMQTAKELRKQGGKERLVWTTGSWLIYTFMKRADKKQRDKLKEAVDAGDLAWHALPFTTHTELMDADLWKYGLSYSTILDEQFNRKTTAAKMTDVPGHTLGIIPFLAEKGITYLHLGVNGASHMPETPRMFRWQAPDKSEIIVQYDKSYGDTFVHPQLDEALVIINSADNHGPPGVDFIRRAFADLQKQFPGAEIRASTLDAFIPNLEKIRGSLPLVTEEIGDTWIHGTGTDPLKVSRYKELLRLRKKWVDKGRFLPGSEEYHAFHDALIMIPEHTWGMDLKKYLGDYKNWSIDDFHEARKADRVDPAKVTGEYQCIYEHAKRELEELYPDKPKLRNRFSYSLFEASHKEQREYIDAALEVLPDELRKDAGDALAKLGPDRKVKKGKPVVPGCPFNLGKFTAVIGGTGSLSSLKNSEGKEFSRGGIGEYLYHTYSSDDYTKYLHEYNRDMEINVGWATPDFAKPGMQYAKPFQERKIHTALVDSISLEQTSSYDEATVTLHASAECPRGAPRNIIIRYRAARDSNRLQVSIDLFDKEATRLPESIWISFMPDTATPARWRFSKLGTLVNPLDVIKGGNRSYHGIEYADYTGADMVCRITPLDTALAALGKPKMVQFDDRFEDPAGGIHFNIYNNMWGTNFPMWYEEDIRARFIVDLG